MLSIVDQLLPDNFLCPVSDTIHSPNPRRRISRFQCFCNALRGLHLLNDPLQLFLSLLVQVGQIGPQFAGQDQVGVLDRMVVLQIVPVYPAPRVNM